MEVLKRWNVSSPEWETSGYWNGYAESAEAPEITCSWAEVSAPTVRAAKVEAVRQWRKSGDLDYCDGGSTNPFKGLKVEEVYPCPDHGYEFEECEMGQCIPYYCEVCEGNIEPIGSEKPFSGGGAHGEGLFAHELCLLPEETHATIVLGDGYFA